jgi:primosomal protein N' (replication factor Y)
MYFYEVAPTKIFRAGGDTLTYNYSQKLKSGTIALIPLGKKTIPGLIIKEVEKPNFPTKPIQKILYSQPLPQHLLNATLWISDYYACPLPTVLQSALPKGIDKIRRPEKPANPSSQNSTNTSIPLNSAQKRALQQITSTTKNTILLHGITGSGKTNIYLELARQTIKKQKSAIILVPEIALTSQLVQNFQAHFDNITLLHSKQTEVVRHRLWEKILNNNQPQIIIGPRSALFAPVKNLNLIIIDEAHEPAYHQDQAPKYSATKLASAITNIVKNTKTDSTPITILGTATPTITDYYIAKQQNAIVSLTELAIKNPVTANLQVIDLKNRTDFKKHRLFSDQLLTSIQNSINTKTQSMIFHNRRGSAPLTVCSHCGWQALCQRCLLPLTSISTILLSSVTLAALKIPSPPAVPLVATPTSSTKDSVPNSSKTNS